jgi:thioredoxin 1
MKEMLTARAWLCGCLLLATCSCQKTTPEGEGASPGEAAAHGKVDNLTDATFDQAVAQGVVLVDFWAPWCGPCRIQGPLVEKAAGLLGDTAKVAKLNVDVGNGTAQKFGIQSIPTLIVFKDGKPAKKFVGVTQPAELVAAVKAALETK